MLTLNCFPPTLIGLEKMKADLTANAYESVVGPVQPQHPFASRSVQRALLTPQVKSRPAIAPKEQPVSHERREGT